MFRDFDELRSTRRVELNAMTSPQFVNFVEQKLRENNVEKIIPDEDLLAKVYTGMERGRRLEEAAQELVDRVDVEDCKPPEDLEKRLREVLESKPHVRRDAAVEAIVKGAGVNEAAKSAEAPG
jgi:hypothetical protein